MAELLVVGNAIVRDAGALRVERRDHLPNQPVLAAPVEGLEDDEQALARFGPQALLEVGELVEQIVEPALGRGLAADEARRRAGITCGKIRIRPRIDPQELGERGRHALWRPTKRSMRSMASTISSYAVA